MVDRTGLMYKISNGGMKNPFTLNDNEWANATPLQLEQWKQAAIARDAELQEIASEIAVRWKQVNALLLEIYGNSRNYKDKPIDYATKLGDKIIKYLSKNDNHPLRNYQKDRYLNLYKTQMAKIEHAKQAKLKAESEKLILQNKVREEQERIMTLGVIAARHGIPLDRVFSARDLMWDLAERDKYLHLALAGQLTRSNWSDGFYLVESAIDAFIVVNDTDKAIKAEYDEILSHPHEDGRVFRDCEYSYDKLSDMVENKQLHDDVMQLLELFSFEMYR